MEKQILLKQTYSPEDDVEHIRWLLEAFDDRRYIRVAGKPLFLIYRVGALPSAARTSEVWRQEARRAGIGDIFLCTVQSNFDGNYVDPRDIGFDAALEFQPHLPQRTWLNKMLERISAGFSTRGAVPYEALIKYSLHAPEMSYLWFRSVTPSWDNTARRKSLVLVHSSPEKYCHWLREVIARSPVVDGEKFIFINAWNEWAEGNHLEPCQKWQRQYLEATLTALEG